MNVTRFFNPITGINAEQSDIVTLDMSLVIVHLRGLEANKAKGFYSSTDVWADALDRICQEQERLLMPQSSEIVEAINRLYRLIDTSFNGVQYTETVNDVNGTAREIVPPIPSVPPTSTSAANAMRAHLGRLWQIAENGATGRTFAVGSGIAGAPGLGADTSWAGRFASLQGTTGGFLGIGTEAVTLADLLRAGRVNTPQDEGLINDGVQEILQTVSQGGSIADVISNILSTGADVATDGGVIAALIASTVAQAAQNGVLASQLDRIIRSIDGGAIQPPQDNILATLNEIETRVS